MQLGTCEVIIKFKNVKKKQCVFFVVPGNSQAMLRMQDTAGLNIIDLNIDSVQTEVVGCTQTLDRKHRLCQREVQTWLQVITPHKMPMIKMAKLLQANQLITFSHWIM